MVVVVFPLWIHLEPTRATACVDAEKRVVDIVVPHLAILEPVLLVNAPLPCNYTAHVGRFVYPPCTMM